MKLDRWLLVPLVVALWLGVALYQRGERLIGAAQQRERDALARVDSLEQVSARLDTVYQRDTVRLWRSVTQLDTLTVRVESWKHDTVRVVEYVTRADSTVRACLAVVRTCEEEKAVFRSTIASMEEARAAHLQTHPSRAKRIVQDLGKVGLGAALQALFGPR